MGQYPNTQHKSLGFIANISCSLHSLKKVIQGSIIGLIKGDTKSLDYRSERDSIYQIFCYFNP